MKVDHLRFLDGKVKKYYSHKGYDHFDENASGSSEMREILTKLGIIDIFDEAETEKINKKLKDADFKNLKKIHYFLEKSADGEYIPNLKVEDFLSKDVLNIKPEEMEQFCIDNDTDEESVKLFINFLNCKSQPNVITTNITVYVDEKKYEKITKIEER